MKIAISHEIEIKEENKFLAENVDLLDKEEKLLKRVSNILG